MKQLLLCLGAGALLFTGCSPIVYRPNVANVPLMQEKGEFDYTLATGTTGSDMQLSYSPVNHLGLMANGTFGARRGGVFSDRNREHWWLEGGAGYYNEIQDNFLVDIYAGGGTGAMKDNGYFWDDWLYGSDTTLRISGSFDKAFVQPTIAFVHKNVDAALTTRFIYLGYAGFSHNNFPQPYQYDLFSDVVFTLRAGHQYVKYFMQFGFGGAISKNTQYRHLRAHMSMGITLNIAPRFKTEKALDLIED